MFSKSRNCHAELACPTQAGFSILKTPKQVRGDEIKTLLDFFPP